MKLSPRVSRKNLTRPLPAGGVISILVSAYTNVALKVPRKYHLHRITTISICRGASELLVYVAGHAITSGLRTIPLLILCAAILAVPFVLAILFFEDVGRSAHFILLTILLKMFPDGKSS